MIQVDVSSLSEFNHPLAELRRHFFDRAANFRVLAECFQALPDGLDGALCGVPALGSQKMETRHVQQGRSRPPQTRHLGGAASLPASSLASQASASSAVTCSPVVW